ncbi:hypothetical protein M434DRAFT_235590 [Hypoxylon sp. CO27-5]|nr:hypothetical protein M434DRAFT_235590 [Hypoxylon sp. CO27-5]
MVNNSSINHRLRENASHSAGEYNSTLQAGYNNQSKIDGNANKTRQFGNGNESKTIGNENTTMQIAIGAIDLGFYTDMFKPFGWLDL